MFDYLSHILKIKKEIALLIKKFKLELIKKKSVSKSRVRSSTRY